MIANQTNVNPTYRVVLHVLLIQLECLRLMIQLILSCVFYVLRVCPMYENHCSDDYFNA